MRQVQSKKKIEKNSNIAWKQTISMIDKEMGIKESRKKLQIEKKKKGLDRDAHNRAYISTRIRQYIQEGMKKNDAVLRVMQEEKEIIEQFKYLEKAGLDLRVVLYNWVSGGQCSNVTKPFSNGDEER